MGSFFTHHFVVGMRGGADRNDNGEVTLTEAFEYAKERTIRDSLRTARETQHPSYAVNLRGRRDLVLAKVAAGPSTVELGQREGPLELIHVASGVQLLELPTGQRRVKLSVPPGDSLIRKRPAPGSVLVKEVAVKAGATTLIDEEQLTLVGSTRLSAKAATLAPAFTTVAGVPGPPNVAFTTLPGKPTPEWIKFLTVSSFVAATGAVAMGIKFQRDVTYYNELLDPYRRFPCSPDDKTYVCDKSGKAAPPLNQSQLGFVQNLTDDGKAFERMSYIAFGTAAVFIAAGTPLLYRWIRGEKPSESEPRGFTAGLLLTPTLAGRPGLAALGTF